GTAHRPAVALLQGPAAPGLAPLIGHRAAGAGYPGIAMRRPEAHRIDRMMRDDVGRLGAAATQRAGYQNGPDNNGRRSRHDGFSPALHHQPDTPEPRRFSWGEQL